MQYIYHHRQIGGDDFKYIILRSIELVQYIYFLKLHMSISFQVASHFFILLHLNFMITLEGYFVIFYIHNVQMFIQGSRFLFVSSAHVMCVCLLRETIFHTFLDISLTLKNKSPPDSGIFFYK